MLYYRVFSGHVQIHIVDLFRVCFRLKVAFVCFGSWFGVWVDLGCRGLSDQRKHGNK